MESQAPYCLPGPWDTSLSVVVSPRLHIVSPIPGTYKGIQWRKSLYLFDTSRLFGRFPWWRGHEDLVFLENYWTPASGFRVWRPKTDSRYLPNTIFRVIVTLYLHIFSECFVCCLMFFLSFTNFKIFASEIRRSSQHLLRDNNIQKKQILHCKYPPKYLYHLIVYFFLFPFLLFFFFFLPTLLLSPFPLSIPILLISNASSSSSRLPQSSHLEQHSV